MEIIRIERSEPQGWLRRELLRLFYGTCGLFAIIAFSACLLILLTL